MLIEQPVCKVKAILGRDGKPYQGTPTTQWEAELVNRRVTKMAVSVFQKRKTEYETRMYGRF